MQGPALTSLKISSSLCCSLGTVTVRDGRTGHSEREGLVIILWLEFGLSVTQGPTQAHTPQVLHEASDQLSQDALVPSGAGVGEGPACPSSLSARPS